MKLTAKIKLTPTKEQHQFLLETLERANAACNYISEIAWNQQTFRAFNLHKLCYYTVKEQFELTAQVVIRAIGQVADSYKKDKKTRRVFKQHAAFPYDSRILKFYVDRQEVSIWTLNGREKISYQAGQRQQELLQFQQGESDLAFIRGHFYLFVTCDIEEPEAQDVEEYLGVDMGIVNIATDSDGQQYSGKVLNRVRHRHRRLRKKLQKKGTKSAKRRLKKLSGKESRFANDVNHCISKAIVNKAERTGRAIAIENLKGIGARVRLKKSQRTQLSSWSFHDLGMKLTYKALRAGIPLVKVDPAYTSQMCSCCGHVDKSNRKTQDNFLCTACGFSAHADINASVNIGRRGAVNHPYADSDLGSNPA